MLDYVNEGMSFSKYILGRCLGRGAFGKVFLAHDIILNRYVAIKIIEASNAYELKSSFKEAELSVRCIHNNIVQIYSADVINFMGHLLFVIEMEYINGCTVESLISNNKLSIVDSVLIIKQILYGIEAAHINDVIHRDIKPGNILVAGIVVKITDFGLANLLGDSRISNSIYYTHTAPEVFDGSVSYSYQTDIYALGLTLYRMVNNISNWRVFLDELCISDVDIKTGEFINQLPWDLSIPKVLMRIIKKACQPDLTKRYSRAVDLRNKLEKLKLGTSWYYVNQNRWCGFYNDKKYVMNIRNKQKGLEVEIKCNDRKILNLCRGFDTYDEALRYCKFHISQTSVLQNL